MILSEFQTLIIYSIATAVLLGTLFGFLLSIFGRK